MEVLFDERRTVSGYLEMSFSCVEDGKTLASGCGFTSRDYMDRAIIIARRRLAGMRPLKPNKKFMGASTYFIIERWNNSFYGKETE